VSQKININNLQQILQDRIGTSPLNQISNLPHPHLLKDMQKATDRIVYAINNNELILLVGDYDVDGITATAILVSFFRDHGFSNLLYTIPDRFTDGYGVKPSVLEKFNDYNLGLVITVDNGISAVEAGEWCKDKNIDFIITDHHTVPEIVPEAYAIVNQKQYDCSFPFDEICGAQISWYLVRSIAIKMGIKLTSSAYTDFVGIAIVADVMPLLEMNRAMLLSSLKWMEKSSRPFFLAIKDELYSGKFTSEEIAFKIAPIINSSGRLAHASYALNAYLSETYEEAVFHVKKLIAFNNERKEIEAEVTKNALLQADCSNSINIVVGDDWHEGVVGIVASRLVDRCHKPAIVFTYAEDGTLKGSGRSLGEVNLYDALYACKHLLIKWGGHKLAGGVSLESKDLDEFKTLMNIEISKNSDDKFYDEQKQPIGVLDENMISFSTIKIIENSEPFGEQNKRPIFLMENAFIQSSSLMQEKHLKIAIDVIHHGVSIRVDAIKFNLLDIENIPAIGSSISFTYTMSINEFRGNQTIQLMIVDIV